MKFLIKKGFMISQRLRSAFIPGLMMLTIFVFGTVSRQAVAEEAEAQGEVPEDVMAQEVMDPTDEVAPQQAPVFAPKTGSSKWSDGWYEGGEGYDAASEEYKKTGKPMAIYISVGWCPYCRKFEKEILSSPTVREFLKDKILVNVDPEASQQENALASQYQVTGFPSFYVHAPKSNDVVRLYTGGTPEEFIEQFEEAAK